MGLAGRSALDKLLALRGGGELVALWAQLASVIDLVAGVALNGVGAGLTVLIAQAAGARQGYLREALRLGLGVAAPVALVAGIAGWCYGEALPRAAILTACVAGWIAIIPGLLNSYWLGQEERGRMLALAAGSAVLLLAAAALTPRGVMLEVLAAAHAVPAIVWLLARPGGVGLGVERLALRRYVLAGLTIGILSPASLLVARALVADALSWHDVGVLQALWRVSDWVALFAGGVLSVYWLPRLAAAREDLRLQAELRAIAARVVLPSGLALGALLVAHRPLLAWLYDPSFAASSLAAALVFAGSLARVLSWAALFALYAMRRTSAIVVGELLSLPLFAALLALAGKHLSLELTGLAWLAAFSVYCGFNFWAVMRR